MLHTICNSCWFVATHFFYLSGTAQYVTLSQYFYFWHTKSDPRDLWPMRHFNRLMRKHDLMNILTIKDKTWKSERPGCPGTWMSKRLGCPGTWMSWDLEVRKTWMSERPGCPGTWMSGDLDVRGPGCPGPECPKAECPGAECPWALYFIEIWSKFIYIAWAFKPSCTPEALPSFDSGSSLQQLRSSWVPFDSSSKKSLTDGPTDGLTWIGTRDTCVS